LGFSQKVNLLRNRHYKNQLEETFMSKRTLSLALILAMVLSIAPITQSARAAGESEPNDSFATAQELALGDSISGNVKGQWFVSGVEQTADPVDYIKVTIPQRGILTFNLEYQTEEGYCTFALLNSGGTSVSLDKFSFSGNSGNKSCEVAVSEGAYYFKLANTGRNATYNYSLSVSFEASSTDVSSGNVDAGDTNSSPETAEALTLGKTVVGRLDSTGRDNNYYRFELSTRQFVTFTYNFKSGVPNHYVTLTQQNTQVEVWWMDNSKPYPFTYKKSLDAGIYYIGVRDGSQPVDHTHDYEITVSAEPIAVTSIAVLTLPTQTTYFVGDTLETAGLTLTATYNDGSVETATTGFTVPATTFDSFGTKTITVTYEGKTAEFSVTAKEVASIAIASQPTKVNYFLGDTFNPAGLTLTLTYTDKTTETISGGFKLPGVTLDKKETKVITVTYGDFTADFNISVKLPVSLDNFTKSETYSQGQFTDLKSDSWYKEDDIKRAYELGLGTVKK
jgi:hypothetical protein